MILLRWFPLVLALTLSEAAASTRLLLVGGGERPESALRRFVEWSGGSKARILIIGWASTIPGEYVRSLTSELSRMGVASVLVSETSPLSPPEREAFLVLLEQATGVFFTGGDQNRAMATIESGAYRDPMRFRFEAGVPFAGTSAGTALMAQVMITGKASPRTAPGLGLFTPAVIDMHFLKRNREPRLLSAMQDARIAFGIGVDENGALAIEDSTRAEVLGVPRVVFYETREDRNLRYELQDRARFDLRKWRPE